jgi:cyclopropane-fatty-acyl-phospholipid synthase
MATDVLTANPALAANQRLLNELLRNYGPRDFAIRYWTGDVHDADPGQTCRFTIILEHQGAVRQMFWPFNPISLGEAYIFGDFEIDGDTHAFVELLKYLLAQRQQLTWRRKLQLLRMLYALPNDAKPRTNRGAQLSGAMHSIERDRQANAFHYDQPDSFYSLWLDREMAYTCAYFRNENDDLDKAQEQKFDHICKKLRLQKGERMLDVGCGWGGLVRHAAAHYGVDALGVTLGIHQAKFATERIKKLGLQDRCRVEVRDYREVGEGKPFDKMSSIGLFEHLGPDEIPKFFREAWKLLKPGGAYLNHHITFSATVPLPKWRAFTLKYVFPDGELQPISNTLRAAEEVGFEVRDVEGRREHYAKTCDHWLAKLEAHRAEATAATDEVVYRIYRLYLAGAAAGFRTGGYGLYQSLLVKPENGLSGQPWTREDWYR